MIFDTSKDFDRQTAVARFEKLMKAKAKFELTEKKPIRSIPQNSYLHLIISWFALEYGETLHYVKQNIFKAIVNADLFIYERVNTKTGSIRKDVRSTALLDSTQMTLAIDRFRAYSVKNGIYLPEAGEIDNLNHINTEIEKQKRYL